MNPPNPAAQPTDAVPAATEAVTETASGVAGLTPDPGARTPDAIEVLTPRGRREQKSSDAIRSYDFRQSGFLAPSELRRIRQRHEQFVRALAARLAMFLRAEFTVQMARLQIVGYQKFIGSLPGSTHVTLFKVEPLKGTGLLALPTRLGLSLVDRLLGGPGQPPDTGRDLSEIETALVDQVASLWLAEWGAHWPEMRELRPVLTGHENNSRFLQTAPPDAAMLALTLEAGFGQPLEPVQFVLPYTTVEPLMRLLNPTGMTEADAAAARPSRLRWNSEFDDVPVPVVVEWQGLTLPAGDITRLKSGDVVLLDSASAAQVQLRLNRVPKFFGRPGTRAGKWAVELTAPVPT